MKPIRLDRKYLAEINKRLEALDHLQKFLDKCAQCSEIPQDVIDLKNDLVARLTKFKQVHFTDLNDGRSPDAYS